MLLLWHMRESHLQFKHVSQIPAIEWRGKHSNSHMKMAIEPKNSHLIFQRLYAFPRIGMRIAYGKYSAEAYQPMSIGLLNSSIRMGTRVAGHVSTVLVLVSSNLISVRTNDGVV